MICHIVYKYQFNNYIFDFFLILYGKIHFSSNKCSSRTPLTSLPMLLSISFCPRNMFYSFFYHHKVLSPLFRVLIQDFSKSLKSYRLSAASQSQKSNSSYDGNYWESRDKNEKITNAAERTGAHISALVRSLPPCYEEAVWLIQHKITLKTLAWRSHVACCLSVNSNINLAL